MILLENYVKAALYVYPRMAGLIDGYRQHIENKAVLSHDGRMPAWKLAEYIAGEILEKERLSDLKRVLDGAVNALSPEEKCLLDMRYFGKMDRVRRAFAAKRAGVGEGYMDKIPYWSERNYYRKQDRLLRKIQSALAGAGISKKVFLAEYVNLDGIAPVYQYLELGKDVGLMNKERDFLRFLAEIKE